MCGDAALGSQIEKYNEMLLVEIFERRVCVAGKMDGMEGRF